MTDDVSDPDRGDDELDPEPWPDDFDFGALDRAVTALAVNLDAAGDTTNAVMARHSMATLREIPSKYPFVEVEIRQLHLALEDMWTHAKSLCELVEKLPPPA